MPAQRPSRQMRAEILSVGTALLLGEIIDTNSAYLAGRLADLGIDCLPMQTVGDNLGRCKKAFERALARSELVVATGGLGPTEDDLTREAIAAALGETPAVDAVLEADLRAWFAGRGLTMPERNTKQAWLIPSARARLGEYVWGVDGESLGDVIGTALASRRWTLALGESLSAGDLARALSDAPAARRQLAGAVVRLGADEGSLERDARSFGADVLLLTPDGDGKVELRAITPERSRQATIHFRSPADGRRRALLSGLDLLRRALLD